MDIVFCMCFTVIIGSLTNDRIEAVQRHCQNEFCPTESLSRSEEPDVMEKLTFENVTNNLNEKEIYMLENLEQAYDNALNKNNYIHESKIENSSFFVETSDKSLFSSAYYTESPERVNNGTVVGLEVSEINLVTNTTINPVFTEKATTKLNSLPTQKELPGSHLILKRNFNLGKSICICDVKVNECDINCCCDEDCSASHFEVFTKCMDAAVLEDTMHCYKNYLSFENNSSHEVVQKTKGIFCIAKENLKVDFTYETKATLMTMEAFNKSLPNKMYAFSYKTEAKSQFTTKEYVAGSNVWTLKNGEVIPLKIPCSTVNLLCNSKVNIKYLVDQTTQCFIQFSNNEPGDKRFSDVLHDLKSTKIISNPNLLNTMQKLNFSKICEIQTCIPIHTYLCWSLIDASKCFKITENFSVVSDIYHGKVLSHIQYHILHNGSKGIVKVEVQLWIKKLPPLSDKFMYSFTADVEFTWLSSKGKTFKRSGNPGYLIGKPVLAGQKISKVNDTRKKEIIEVSSNPNDWLSVLGSEKGICSLKKRVPIYFKENGIFTCSLKLSKNNFTKERCVELQNNIFSLLLGQDVLNNTKENYFNKFVAVFGNSKVEETGDWVQVLIDLFPLNTAQTSFKSNHYFVTCKNIITDLYINIIYSKIGSIFSPQAKILGVSFQFGEHKDLTYGCDSPRCENTSLIRGYKLSSSVRFIDVTKPPKDAFAEPHYLEVKLPHDFFYPFFSKAYRNLVFNKFVFLLFLLAFL